MPKRKTDIRKRGLIHTSGWFGKNPRSGKGISKYKGRRRNYYLGRPSGKLSRAKRV